MAGIPDKHVRLQEEVPEEKTETPAAAVIAKVQEIVYYVAHDYLERRDYPHIGSGKKTVDPHHTIPRNLPGLQNHRSCC